MTAWIVGHTTRFKAGVMGAGVSDWGMMIATSDIPTYEQFMGGGNPYEGVGPHAFDAQSPASFVSQVTTPVLIVHGERDETIPVAHADEIFKAAAGSKTLLRLPNSEHTSLGQGDRELFLGGVRAFLNSLP